MPTVDVVDLNNQKVSEVELADDVFGAPVNESLLYEAVRQFQASNRAGTHTTKVRSEVAGSGKKLWKQKGTGRARVGSVRSPIWRHGGTVHGPQPRDYSYKLPKKMLVGALRARTFGQAAGRRVEGRAGVQFRRPQDQERDERAGQAWKPGARFWCWITTTTATWNWDCATSRA